MAFVLTVLYVALSLLSPSVLPQAIWSLHVNIILGIATILALLPQLGAAKLKSIPDTYFVAGLLFAAALSTVHLGFSVVPGKVMDYVPIFIVFYFVLIGCRTLFQIKVLSYVLLAVALFVFLQGFMADRAHEVMSPYLIAEGVGDQLISRYQGLGVLSDPNDLAQLFVTMVPLLFLRWSKGNPVGNLLFTLFPAALLIAGLYFTHSRGGLLALIAVVLFGFKDKLGVTLSAVLAVGLLGAAVALNASGGRGLNDDDGGRVAAWSTGLEIFRSHPLVGVGIDQFADYNDTGHTAHNSYILCLAETGLIGYFCWMGTIVSSLTGLSQIARKKKSGHASGAEDRSKLPPHLRWRAPAVAQTVAVTAAPFRTAALASPGFASVAFHEPAQATWAPPSVRFGALSGDAGASADDADLVHAAKVLRVAFVGLLTSAFFLSRSFSMVFYVMLGMAASVRMIYLARHPEQTINNKLMIRRVLMVLGGSVIFLYLFVRIRGIH
jgi:O-antigen ligase